MKYAYYPGCSLRESAQEYDVSTRAVLERLGVLVEEIPDWTCCGASAVESVDHLLALALPARNLALAEKELPGLDVLVPCSACYLNLLKFQRTAQADRSVLAQANTLIGEEGLSCSATGGRVRHLLDVLINDIGPDAIRERVARPLSGIVVAPYYGCQILRPYRVFDDPERPSSMVPLLEALGARIHPWNMGGVCCGASLMATHKEAALVSVGAILRAAVRPHGGDGGADVIATVCPMCQMNLEAYQAQALRGGGTPVSVLYLPQLIGLAMGLPPEQTLLRKNLAVTETFRSRLFQPKEPSVPATAGA
ncbi:CoB--CoM heterodisulfide reductase iron-sulfur subunit B family protein [Desulfolutivibrio sulfoxidireducens]|uniref:CoB--CoM heterodisulfide reductase iron-sulfur subunit B family protein n=1 Tax=Desulfolutivibrio sulfoxidireducens TaxID=2773299 RepID=UPI00159DD7E8|nr:CoB--CoM heterodisulfide reductase iron-sulfur subunit B family protein [Desulfolutivibrio sulfoxidireducens]QLA16889.1 disulfide reductase [Desulfolutivibrio sulfoxidireducens]QLA20455.1 disulfide reductase [Desulfolutivibrio sulfoxidireducens]